MASNILSSARFAAAWFVTRLGIKNERGATAVEYAVMVALIAAVIILAVVFLGRTASSSFSGTANCVSTTASAAGC